MESTITRLDPPLSPKTPAAPQVFVSSTIADMRDLRSALKHWLQSLGFRYFFSEYAGSEKTLGKGTYDTCYTSILESDVYVLIIGDRVGSLVQESPPISITRREYQIAYESYKDKGRPIPLFFVRQEVAEALRWDLTRFSGSDVDHIKEFIAEVERETETIEPGADPPVANWLHRFREFDEITDAIARATGVHGDSLRSLRLDLIREDVSRVLTYFVGKRPSKLSYEEYLGRLDQSEHPWVAAAWSIIKNDPELLKMKVAMPDVGHRVASGSFESYVSLEDGLLSPTIIDDRNDANRIGIFCMSITVFKNLRWPRLHQAHVDGWFREYDSTQRRSVSTDLQSAVDQIVLDLESLRSVTTSSAQELLDLQAAVLPFVRRQQGYAQVQQSYIGTAAGLHNAAENTFKRLVALLAHLEGRDQGPSVPPEALGPHSPYAGQDEKIESERMSPDEIAILVRLGGLGER